MPACSTELQLKIMDHYIVGNEDCSYNRIVSFLLSRDTGGIVAANWERLARELGINDVILVELRRNLVLENTENIIHKILREWRMARGNKATLSELCEHLKSLEWENIKDSIESEFTIEVIPVQNEPKFKNTLPEPLSFYVQRQISPRYTLSKDIFTVENATDIIVVLGLERHQLTALTKGKISDTSRDQVHHSDISVSFIHLDLKGDWLRLCKKSQRSIHLIACNYEREEFVWIDSKGDISFVQKYIAGHHEQFTETSFVSEVECKSAYLRNNHAICISDTPGMGKSILLAEIGRHLKNIDNNMIIVYVVIAEWVSEIRRQMELRPDLLLADVILDSLAIFCCDNILGSDLLKEHLTSNLEMETKLELLFDGFDEVNSKDFQLAYDCLKHFLRSRKNTRIWVSTRPHMRDALEKYLCVLGYNIVPFTKSDQEHFLERYWTRKTGLLLIQQKLRIFAQRCLEALKAQLNSRDEDIAGVPLQCMLIAEAFENEAHDYASCDDEADLKIYAKSVIDLYDILIQNKFKKLQLTWEPEGQGMPDVNRINLAHTYLAFKLIFPNCINIFHRISFLDKDHPPLKILLKVGIVEEGSTGEVRFIHRTFAEYFIAWFIKESLSTEWSKDMTIFLISQVLDSSHFKNQIQLNPKDHLKIQSREFSYPVVCYFLDGLLRDIKQESVNHLQTFFNPIAEKEALVKYLLFACIQSDSYNLLKFLHLIMPLQNHPDKYFTKELCFTLIWRSSLELICFYTEAYLRSISCDTINKKTVVHVAVKRGSYTIVNYIVHQPGFVDLVKKMMTTVISDCISWTNGADDQEISEREQIMKTLLNIARSDFVKYDLREILPILENNVHINVLISLVRGENQPFGPNFIKTVLCNVTSGKYTSSRNFHKLLENVSSNNLTYMLTNNKYILHDWVSAMNLRWESLTLLKDCGADFNATDETGNSVLHASVQSQNQNLDIQERRTMWENLIFLGANYKLLTTSGSVLHHSARCGNFQAFLYFLSKDGLHVNFPDNNGHTPFDFTIKSNDNGLERYKIASYLNDRHASFNHKTTSSLFRTVANLDIFTIRIIVEFFKTDVNVKHDDGRTLLHHVFEKKPTSRTDNNRYEIIDYLLNKEAHINGRDNNKETPLLYALRHKPENLCLRIYNLLRERTAILTTADMSSVLFWISTWEPPQNEVEIQLDVASNKPRRPAGLPKTLDQFSGPEYIQRIIRSIDFNVNTHNSRGLTPLHYALYASYGCFSQTVKALLYYGADVGIVNGNGMTPLTYSWDRKICPPVSYEAVVNGRLTFLQGCLLNHRFPPETRDSRGHTYIHKFISAMKDDTPRDFHKLVEILNKTGNFKALKIAAEEENTTPLMMATEKMEISQETITLLQEKNIDFNQQDRAGQTILHYAVKSQRSIHFLQNLVELGARCNCESTLLPVNFQCVLHLAASSLPVLRFLLLKMGGCKINVVDGQGNMPLHLVRGLKDEHELMKIVKFFVSGGADVNRFNKEGETPFEGIIRRNNLSDSAPCKMNLLKFLIKQASFNVGAKLHPQGYTVVHNYIKHHIKLPSEFHELVKVLEETDNVNVLEIPGGELMTTPLHLAVANTDIQEDTLDILCQHEVNLNMVNARGNSVLHEAVIGMRSIQFLNTLVEFQADWEVVNKDNSSVLHLSASAGNAEAVKYFVRDLGAEVNEIDIDGNTPVHCAVACGNMNVLEITKFLVENASDITVRNKKGETPFEIAQRRKLHADVQALLDPENSYY